LSFWWSRWRWRCFISVSLASRYRRRALDLGDGSDRATNMGKQIAVLVDLFLRSGPYLKADFFQQGC
jgi:hypothetical protein